jgi:hypothetical protein
MGESLQGGPVRIVQAEDLLARERVQEEGVRVVGQLDLSDSKLTHPLVLRNCYVEEEIVLRRAEVPSVDLRGSHLWGLDAAQLRTRDDVDLSGARTTGRPVSLGHARLGGSLRLNGARLSNLNGCALDAMGVVVEQSLLGRRGFGAVGEVVLSGAHVKGTLNLSGARLFNPGRVALDAIRIRVDQGLSCPGVVTTGQVVLVGGQIGGDLVFDGARLGNSTGDALTADDLTVTGSAYFRSGFQARGAVWLVAAHVGGAVSFAHAHLGELRANHLRVGQRLDCGRLTATGELMLENAQVKGDFNLMDARLANRGGDALFANNIAVAGAMFANGVAATGRLSLASAHVGGNLSLSRAHLRTPGRDAVFADDAVVERAVYLYDSTVEGELWFVRARMASLSLGGTKITNPDGVALRASALRVDADVVAASGFSADGEIRLIDAAIGGRLDLGGALVDVLDLEGLRAGTLLLLPRRTPGRVDLTNAEVGGFEDNPATWPDSLRLQGFSYDVISGAPVRDRVKWLRRHEGGYAPGLYDNLAAAYKRAGRVEFARRVGIAKQWHRRTEMNPLGKALNWLLYLTVGYGYRTSLAWVWLAALLAAGTVVFAGANPADITPATPTAAEFQPFVYALDVLLPIVDLGQQKDWVAHGPARWWVWGLVAAGWILTTAVVAGLTTALKRD